MKNRNNKRSLLAFVLAAVTLLNCFPNLLPVKAAAASSSEIKKQIQAVQKEKEALKEQMAQVQTQYEANENALLDLISQKNVLDQEIGLPVSYTHLTLPTILRV